VLEPGVDLSWNWHLDAICDHLQAVTEQRVTRLLINVPPGHGKSLLVSVLWPAWVWTRQPSWRALFASYALTLAIRDSVRCRDLITSDWYRSTFTPAWRLKGDQNVKSYFENTATGFRVCLSVGSQATGYRGDAVVVDDPLNASDALSDLARAECQRWWDVVMSSRLNDLRTGARVVIMQRLHHQDLAGVLIERGGYEVLRLPSEFEPDCRSTTSIGWTDPRDEPGELLFPERFPASVIDQAKQDLGPDHYASQHQQRPTPREGSFFQRSWFEIVEAVPAHATTRRYRGWDRAATEGAGDWTAGVKIATHGGSYYIEDVVRCRHGPGDRDKLIRQTAVLDGPETRIVGEQEPGASGVDQAQAFVRLLAGFSVSVKPSSGSKIVRADPLASQAKAGNVKLLKGPWNAAFLDELCQFPLGAHDDQVDAASLAFNALALGSQSSPRVVSL
jgi:predicted phage terminase large subunit-like protein